MSRVGFGSDCPVPGHTLSFFRATKSVVGLATEIVELRVLSASK